MGKSRSGAFMAPRVRAEETEKLNNSGSKPY